jgi:hypothetical protein
MNYQEAIKWANRQDVVQVRAIKENEEDKFTFTVGEYIVSPLVFDTQEQAESFLKLNFKLTNLDLSIIGAMCQKLNELNNQQLKNKTK